jgi:hypothetical protein
MLEASGRIHNHAEVNYDALPEYYLVQTLLLYRIYGYVMQPNFRRFTYLEDKRCMLAFVKGARILRSGVPIQQHDQVATVRGMDLVSTASRWPRFGVLLLYRPH